MFLATIEIFAAGAVALAVFVIGLSTGGSTRRQASTAAGGALAV